MDAALFRTIDGTTTTWPTPPGAAPDAVNRFVQLLRKEGHPPPMPTALRPGRRPAAARAPASSATRSPTRGRRHHQRPRMSAMIYAWGQFLDHDLDLTPAASPAESFNVAVPTGDPSFDPAGTGTQVIPLTRSLVRPGHRHQRRQPAAAGQRRHRLARRLAVYGSDAATADKLRDARRRPAQDQPGADGVIGTADDLLPFNNAASRPARCRWPTTPTSSPTTSSSLAGDVRANENIELTACRRCSSASTTASPTRSPRPTRPERRGDLPAGPRPWSSARSRSITYNEWLPALLGPSALRPYRGYNPNVNPGIANEFSTAAFRLGHSLLGDDVEFLDNNGNEPVADEVAAQRGLLQPGRSSEQTGIDPILKYLASDPSQEIDTKVVDSVRNFLFGPPGAGRARPGAA